MADIEMVKGDYYEVEIGEGKRAVYRYGGPGDNWSFEGYHARPLRVLRRVDKPNPNTCTHPSIGRFGQCRYCGDETARVKLEAYRDMNRRFSL